MLDGVFAFILYDSTTNTTYLQEIFGVRPLYIGTNKHNTSIGLSSEIKIFHSNFDTIKQCSPSYYSVFNLENNNWKEISINPFFKGYSIDNKSRCFSEYCSIVREALITEVEKRVENTERDIAVLISGGLDSSIVASIVCNYIKENILMNCKSFSIGMEGSQDQNMLLL